MGVLVFVRQQFSVINGSEAVLRNDRAPVDRSVAAAAKIVLHESSRAVGGRIVVSTDGASVEVETATGQVATDVAAEIAAAVNGSLDFQRLNISAIQTDAEVSFNNPVIYACSFSEAELGLPSPPRIRECRWDVENQLLVFLWENAGSYDTILIVDRDGVRMNDRRLDGESTGYNHRVERQTSAVFRGHNRYGVVGVSNGIRCRTSCEIELRDD